MISPFEIAEAIQRTQDEIEELVDEVRNAGYQAATADVAFKVAFAKHRLASRAEAQASGRKFTIDSIEDEATVATEKERMAFTLAANNLTVVREALGATKSRLDGYRTMSASVRLAGG